MERANSVHLDAGFYFKKLKSLDYLIDDFNEIRQLEEEYQRQDAALTLLSGELRELINGLMKIFVNHAEMKSAQIEKVAEDCTI